MLLSFGSRHSLEKVIVRRKKKSNTIHLVILGYLAIISVGTFLLSLPVSQAQSLSFLDNFFVATSAICVTGLSTIDIGTSYSHFGHWVLIFLMQIGGLGIMCISTTLILFAGMRPSFLYESVLLQSFSQDGSASPSKILKAVLPFTFILEAFGVLIYFLNFREEGVYDRFFASLFQSISSFCNVGFSLYPNSLMNFAEDPFVVIGTSVLVIAGGFGFLAILDLRCLFNLKKRISLHTKLASLMTIILLVVGMAFFFFIEYGNSIAAESIPQKILSSFSFSFISRTAGLNLVDFSTLSGPSVIFTIILMFIGANPGSCGGGIKTTTAAVIVIFAVNNLIFGRNKTQIFNKTIPQDTVNKAVHIFIIGVLIIIFASLVLLISEIGSAPYTSVPGEFLQILFEVTSAYATCGLSLGFTSQLSEFGKLVICMVMFIGRLGPLFLISAVTLKDKDSGLWYSEENIMVG